MWSKSRKGGNATYAPQLSDDETENNDTMTTATKNVTKNNSTNVSSKSSKNKNINPYHQPLQHTSSMPTTTSKNNNNNQKSSNKSSMPKSSSSLQVSQQQQSPVSSSLSSSNPSLLSFKPIIENSSNPVDLVGKYVSFSKNLDNLLVDRKMAEGGFSTVYSVKKQKQNFALKRLFVNSIQDLKACKIEIELMHSLLNKPNFINF